MTGTQNEDIVDRLSERNFCRPDDLLEEAVAEIERLRRDVSYLRVNLDNHVGFVRRAREAEQWTRKKCQEYTDRLRGQMAMLRQAVASHQKGIDRLRRKLKRLEAFDKPIAWGVVSPLGSMVVAITHEKVGSPMIVSAKSHADAVATATYIGGQVVAVVPWNPEVKK